MSPQPRDAAVEIDLADFERHEVDESIYVAVLADTVAPLEAAEIPYVLIGGVASAVYGRPRWSTDIDVLVRPEDRHRTLRVLAEAGFATEETNPQWIFKAAKHRVLIDIIFKCQGLIYLGDEMLRRARREEFRGVPVTVVSPEDLVVLKVVAHDEASSRHWFDALGILTRDDLDWAYLLQRARHGTRRVLSLLLYAQAEDITVPNEAVNALIGFLNVEGVGAGA